MRGEYTRLDREDDVSFSTNHSSRVISDLIFKIVRLEITGRASFDHDFAAGESEDAQSILGAWRRMATIGIGRKGFVVSHSSVFVR